MAYGIKSFLLAGAALVAVSVSAPVSAQQAQGTDFATWLQGVKSEAAGKGIRPQILDEALTGVEHIDRVIELDRKQPEFSLTFEEYLGRTVNSGRVAKGRKLMAENRTLLAQVEKRYGVQPRFVVALWGIETDFGRVTGGFSVVSALATLAYDGRRSEYFRGELMNALEILNQGHITASNMKGSWAGAMGQCQFMPSSFLKFAQDFNGDGRRDIWTTRADVLASAANYLSTEGWDGDKTWGRAVHLPKGFNAANLGLDKAKSLKEWSQLGVRRADGRPLPHVDIEGSIVLAEKDKGPAFLVYDNFRTIMKWNRSTYFALAVGHLADKLGAR